ncbi:hypothetical protein BKA56DRAFT_608422 [Ilyonectria sp. MPI-CAGE-AT-0026]|nr:hypothetical protein BKA56DRAFT_608422 [Ilyonectria sp. MPI-CAGE-AT-0026]
MYVSPAACLCQTANPFPEGPRAHEKKGSARPRQAYLPMGLHQHYTLHSSSITSFLGIEPGWKKWFDDSKRTDSSNSGLPPLPTGLAADPCCALFPPSARLPHKAILDDIGGTRLAAGADGALEGGAAPGVDSPGSVGDAALINLAVAFAHKKRADGPGPKGQGRGAPVQEPGVWRSCAMM